MSLAEQKPSVDSWREDAKKAIQEAVAQVIAEHKRLGMPLSILRDGKVVRISAEEAEAEHAARASTEANGS